MTNYKCEYVQYYMNRIMLPDGFYHANVGDKPFCAMHETLDLMITNAWEEKKWDRNLMWVKFSSKDGQLIYFSVSRYAGGMSLWTDINNLEAIVNRKADMAMMLCQNIPNDLPKVS